ncbi:N-acyl homoserine lactonase family protein [Gordonia desulfuricans]|uniref:N-acyl homoserine lactonase family protein n=1 Tax=Gordonia desulfuricans TaxID=89051 RepID=A0A7K3LN57_9ACTN|nr:N-acyl homoserine lactonase family protein [Gordonia desulfuricans]NDK89623.1 N-acyl homoserine lactonase family protein [Gordonia desulfuricans]
MTVRLSAMTLGHVTIPTAILLEGREGNTTVPVTSYLIEHPCGRAVFDTGMSPAIQDSDDPAGHVGDLLAALHVFDYTVGEDLAARLRALDVDPGSIDHVINSHLHFDHCGGNAQVPNAEIVLQGREVTAADEGGELRGYIDADYDTGQPRRLVDGEHDLFGDGSVVLFPTYGHTPGHQSARVRTDAGEFVLCGDACYLQESLETLTLPGVIADPESAMASLECFRALQAAGSTIMFGHDLDFWATVPQAPARLG